MKRSFLIILPGLVAAAAAAPALLGVQLERNYRATVEQMVGDGLRVVRSQYQRGWLSSTAETDLLIAMPTGDNQGGRKDLVLTLRNHIDHGPLIPDGSVLMGRMETELLSDGEPMFSPGGPSQLRTRVALLGQQTTMVVDLPAQTIAEAEGRPGLVFEGLSGELRFGESNGYLAGALEMTGLALVKGAQPVMRVRGATASWQMRRGAGGLLFGNAHLGLDRAEIADPVQGTRVTLQGFAVESTSRVTDDRVDMRLSYTLAQASIDDRAYGPADVRVHLGNLSAEVLGRIREQLAEKKARGLGREQKSLAVLGILMTNAPQLLRSDPSFAIEHLRLDTPDGTIEGNLYAQARGMVWPTSDPTEPLRSLDIKASLRLPEPVFRVLLEPGAREQQAAVLDARRRAGEIIAESTPEQRAVEVQRMVDQQLTDIIRQGILRRDQQALTMSARLRDGRLEINGRRFPLPVR